MKKILILSLVLFPLGVWADSPGKIAAACQNSTQFFMNAAKTSLLVDDPSGRKNALKETYAIGDELLITHQEADDMIKKLAADPGVAQNMATVTQEDQQYCPQEPTKYLATYARLKAAGKLGD